MTATRLGAGGLTVRAAPSRLPEVDALGRALAGAAEQVAAALGRERAFSADAAHQLRSPLTAMRLELDTICPEELPATATAAAALGALAGQLDRLDRVTSELLAFARDGRAGPVEDFDLDSLVAERVEAVRPLLERAGRTLHAQLHPAVARSSRAAVTQALDVLLDNAITHGAGSVTVACGGSSTVTSRPAGAAGSGWPWRGRWSRRTGAGWRWSACAHPGFELVVPGPP